MCIWPSISEDKPRLPRCIQTSKRHAVLLQDGFLSKKKWLPKKTWIWIYIYMYTEFFEPHGRGDRRFCRRQVDDTDRFNEEKNHGVEHDTSIGFDDMHNVGWMYAQCWMDARLGFSSIFFWEAFIYLGLFHPFGNCLPASIEGRLWSGAKSGITTSAGHASSRLKSGQVVGRSWMILDGSKMLMKQDWDGYPLVNITLLWKDPPFSMGKLTISIFCGHFQ